MRNYFLLIIVACLLAAPSPKSPTPTATKMTQIRIFTINRGKMDAFVDAWLKGVYPLRTKSGFKIERAWVVKEKNKFIWVLSYDGPEGFEAKDSAYYASEKRKILDPDPAQYIADVEKYFIEAVR